jgi:Amt family ammonium transporter
MWRDKESIPGRQIAWRRIAIVASLTALVLMALGGICAAQGDGEADSTWLWQLPPLYLFSWLLPLGLALIAAGTHAPDRTRELATAMPLALVVALGGYTLCGFGLQLGGIGLVIETADLDHLIAEWSPLDLRMGAGWGLVGLHAIPFAPSRASAAERALFLSQLPWVTTAALIPLASLHSRAPRLAALGAAGLAACICYPLAGNWILSGGWLSQLGITLGFGQGFVDSAAGFPLLIGSLLALAGLLAFRKRMAMPLHSAPELPQAHLALYVLLGAFLAFLGWLGALISQPLGAPERDTTTLLLNALGSVAGASAATLFYGWLVRGRADATLSARGIVTGLAAVSAGVGWISFGAAVALGAVAGLLLGPVTYLTERLLGLEDAGAAAGMLALPTLLGLLATGALPGVPVSAAVSASQGQLQAQLIGAGALIALAGIIPWIVLGILAQAYEMPIQVAQHRRKRAAHPQPGQARPSSPFEPGPVALWRWIKKAWPRPRVRTGRRLRHRERAAAHMPSSIAPNPTRAEDPASDY